MKASDAVINSSVEPEPGSRSVIEGLGAGVPVIVSACGGNTELVRHEFEGFHFPVGDHHVLATWLERLMSNPGRLAYMKDFARQRYEQMFTAERYVRDVERVYQNIGVI
jgi:glycosyltransferase involved in cell wall biosynthesis